MNKCDNSRDFRDSQNELNRFMNEVKINIDNESALIRILKNASYEVIDNATDIIDTWCCFENKDKIIKLFKDELKFRDIE